MALSSAVSNHPRARSPSSWRPFEAALAIEPARSVRALARLGLACLLTFPTLLLHSPSALRIPVGCLMCLLLLRDAGRWRRGPLPVHWRQLVSLPGGRWRALTRSNDSVPLEFIGAPTVSRHVVRLDFRSPDGRVSLVLARDALTAPLHRRLRVRLRWDGPAREFTGRIRCQSGT